MQHRDERTLSFYDRGPTPLWACRQDPRFSWCAYVPASYEAQRSSNYRLLVAVHGTLRVVALYRDVFADFAERHRLIVLAPLFPGGITSPADLSSYKLLRAGTLHYDSILLSMVEEVGEKYGIDIRRFLLFGFSGGGHFAHRFFYLHPDRLAAVSIGAPGVVTLLDRERDFWVGVRNFEALFGRRLDIEAMRATPVQMVIGAEDKETWEITIRPGNAWYMEGADLAGGDRLARLRALKASFEAAGIAVRHDVVPDAAHRMEPMVPAVEDFLAETLKSAVASQSTATGRLA
jgi:pimeloyl-ACP methyl ester carboxylesterase